MFGSNVWLERPSTPNRFNRCATQAPLGGLLRCADVHRNLLASALVRRCVRPCTAHCVCAMMATGVRRNYLPRTTPTARLGMLLFDDKHCIVLMRAAMALVVAAMATAAAMTVVAVVSVVPSVASMTVLTAMAVVAVVVMVVMAAY